ncbi:MAG TPA: SRPBCC family protein [Bacteroidales bacterium]
METVKNNIITVETTVLAPIKKVWSYWTEPCHITKWCFASDDWQAPYAENDLRVKGNFKTKMASKDGSAGFDFEGVYTRVVRYKLIEYAIADGRKVVISFSSHKNKVKVVESFVAENENSYEMQKGGWQSILDNFRKYVESNS